MIYLSLFMEFFKIGLFSIGGGLATLPFLNQLIYKYGWVSSAELLDMIAISESTPGPIGINMATFVGYKTGGISGGIIATVGLVMPSIIIIILIAHYFSKFSEEDIVKSSFYGIRPAVAGLIGAAGLEMARVSIFNIESYMETKAVLQIIDVKGLILFTIMVVAISRYKKHPIIYIMAAALIGIVFKY